MGAAWLAPGYFRAACRPLLLPFLPSTSSSQRPAIMSYIHRTVIDGKGYSFKLPSLGLPDPAGEWVVVECCIAKPPSVLDDIFGGSSSGPSPFPPTSPPPKRRMRFPFGDYTTIQVNHDHAIWYLPILGLSPEVGDDCYKAFEIFTVRVQRKPSEEEQTSGGNDATTPMAPLSRSPSTLSLASASESKASSFANLDIASTFSDISLANSASTSSLGASSSVTSTTPSDDSDDGDDSDTCVDFGLDTGGMPPLSAMISVLRSKARDAAKALSGQMAKDAFSLVDKIGGSFDLEPNLSINTSFRGQILWLRYVDKLPQGDPVPAWAKSIDPRLENPSYWAVKLSERICYHQARVPKQYAQRYWDLLTGPGLPCKLDNHFKEEDQWIKLQYQPSSWGWLKLCGELPSKSSALLKVKPIPPDYACQPAGASAGASYMLNNYQILIEQDGEEYTALEPLAELVDPVADGFLRQLAEYASAAGAPGKIPYYTSAAVDLAEEKNWASSLYHVGIRLRDGGSRFNIDKTPYPHRLVVSLPGTGRHLARFGTFERVPTGAKATERKTIELTIHVPPGAHDIVLRVADAPQGKFKKIEYVLRRQKETEPIKEDEWKPFVVGPKDGWVLSYFANLARLSFGTTRLLRPPPGTKSFSDK